MSSRVYSYTINGRRFWHHTASDIHGTTTHTHMVDGEAVSFYEYMDALQSAISPMENELLTALGAISHYRPDWKNLS